MSVQYKIDSKHKLVISQLAGVFASVDYMAHLNDLLRDAEFNADFDQLVDCTGLTQVKMSSEEIRIAAGYSAFSTQSKRAVVAISDFEFGLSRMFAAYRESKTGQSVQVFRSFKDAFDWLQLPMGYRVPQVTQSESA